jgi:hypothetical protein
MAARVVQLAAAAGGKSRLANLDDAVRNITHREADVLNLVVAGNATSNVKSRVNVPGGARTYNLRLRRPTLCPIELREPVSSRISRAGPPGNPGTDAVRSEFVRIGRCGSIARSPLNDPAIHRRPRPAAGREPSATSEPSAAAGWCRPPATRHCCRRCTGGAAFVPLRAPSSEGRPLSARLWLMMLVSAVCY